MFSSPREHNCFSRKESSAKSSLDQLIELDLSSRPTSANRAQILSRSYSYLILSSYELQVLLVTSSRRPDSWIVPGGGVEPEEEPSVTALREVREEAGVLGQLGRCLGTFEVITRDVCHTDIVLCFINVFFSLYALRSKHRSMYHNPITYLICRLKHINLLL